MKIKFNDGTIKECTQPMEQKLFRDGVAVGWLLSFSITGEVVTSDNIDKIITADNVSNLTFTDDEENNLYVLSGYTQLASVAIRHSDTQSRAELQIKKLAKVDGEDA